MPRSTQKTLAPRHAFLCRRTSASLPRGGTLCAAGLQINEDRLPDLFNAAIIDSITMQQRISQAKQDKQWPEADAIRDQLKQAGVILEDSPAGTTWRRA